MSEWWSAVITGAVGGLVIALTALSVWTFFYTWRTNVYWSECRQYYDEHEKRQEELGTEYEIKDITWAMIRAKRKSGAKTYLPPLDAWVELFNGERHDNSGDDSVEYVIVFEDEDGAA